MKPIPEISVSKSSQRDKLKKRSKPSRWQDQDEMRWAARHWAVRIGVKVPQIHIRSMKRKWASISTAGRLTLDASLLSVPKQLGEFVIVHELVHLLVPNHGKVFKSFMLAYLPDWEERELQLRKFSARSIDKKSMEFKL